MVKGYLGRAYEVHEGYFLKGITLHDVIEKRAKKDLPYTDHDIVSFISQGVKTINFLEDYHGMFHGGLCPR